MSTEKAILVKVLSVRRKYALYGGITYQPVKICDKQGNTRVVCLDDLYVNSGDELKVKDVSTNFITLYRVLENYTQQEIINKFVKQK